MCRGFILESREEKKNLKNRKETGESKQTNNQKRKRGKKNPCFQQISKFAPACPTRRIRRDNGMDLGRSKLLSESPLGN
jgi:hypothetical protein